MALLQYQTKTQDSRIQVVPSEAKYANQMVDLMCDTYHVSKEDTYDPDQFRSQIRMFPQGQYLAIDTHTDRVVGLTISMQVAFDPNQPLLETWVETTNYG